MNLHEFQAKQLFNRYGIMTPEGYLVTNISEARQAAKQLGGKHWVVKAQAHTGGRGKAGGVKIVDSLDHVSNLAYKILSRRLFTHQTITEGLPVNHVLIEKPSNIKQELYIAVLIDRLSESVVFMVSPWGGVDIEAVATKDSNAILNLYVDPIIGLQNYQCRRAGYFLGLFGMAFKHLQVLMHGLYQLFIENDASLVEINPLVITKRNGLLAIDAKLDIDDNSIFRHARLEIMFDPTQEAKSEVIAKQFGLNYISLDGTVACMVNGAGLAMATMDLIQMEGGEPANFLDVGGRTTPDRIAEAFKLILSNRKVMSILVNIFGGIIRCDLIAEGVIQAVRDIGISIPLIVRLEGTHSNLGRTLLSNSNMNISISQNLTNAVKQAVKAAQEWRE